jgi:hypothetical protein
MAVEFARNIAARLSEGTTLKVQVGGEFAWQGRSVKRAIAGTLLAQPGMRSP